MTTLDGSSGGGIVSRRWLPRHAPVNVRYLLNVICVGLVVATLADWSDPDLVLDALWVTLAIGAFVFGLRGTINRIVLISLLALAASAVASIRGLPHESEVLDPEWLLMVALTLLIAVAADRVSTTARRYAALYRQASDRLVTAHEDERARLARDLHDGVGQTLTAVVLMLDAAAAALSSGPDAPSGMAAVRRARALALAALDEARSVASQLRPARMSELGLGAAVSDLAGSAGVPVDVWFTPSTLPPGLIQPEREIDAYRVIQEALSNAARHSHATHVWIDAEVRDGQVRVQIGDNGVGFDEGIAPAGMGLAGMGERAAILNGQLDVQSQPGAGTTVNLVFPVLAPGTVEDLLDAAVRPETTERRPDPVGMRP